MIDTIMIFAAGRGSRMKHLSAERPKPLIPVLGKSILYHVLELTLAYPFKKIIINTHYLSTQVEDSIREFQIQHSSMAPVEVVYEQELLETGGAIKNVFGKLNREAIFTINSDTIIKTEENIFYHMNSQWAPEKMNFLLLLQSVNKITGYTGNGDLDLLPNGQTHRSKRAAHEYLYTGLQILKPSIVNLHPAYIFSLKEYYIENNPAVYGTVIDSVRLYHATHPEDIEKIEKELRL